MLIKFKVMNNIIKTHIEQLRQPYHTDDTDFSFIILPKNNIKILITKYKIS